MRWLITELQAKQWLQLNAPHIELLEWGGSGNINSKFIDNNRNLKFEYRFSALKSKLKQNPNKLFGLTTKQWKESVEKTCMERYGIKNPQILPFFKEKRKQTNLKRYGVENISQNNNIKEKKKQTYLKKYNVESPQQNKQINEKTLQTKINRGIIPIIDGITLTNWAKNSNLGCLTTICKAYKLGIHPQEVKSQKSILEIKIKQLLDEIGIEYRWNKQLPEHKGIKKGNKKPDFLIIKYRIIIECDGEWFHKNKQKDLERNKLYEAFGYRVLCFSGQEIINNWNKVKNIILENIK